MSVQRKIRQPGRPSYSFIPGHVIPARVNRCSVLSVTVLKGYGV
ncbi:hypothetical protein NBRC3257_1745 [Gluconobacter thailandicus NBRC 3257]|uniref:Transposase n=1 Tax=Gluconobacter thailandicus NBRC 3257 TaxID=1381097 RepID=A0ABQ0IX19_GLUTH|nr:hypothetical protein NBRC3255_2378 [Gluconobacter thailandicus NBRC 3255]GAD26747.1 hypothetical protein NBRC3257_1745 [Gluconobacter thailandicus NBRC 3257]